jgi:hypothetical protein
MQNGSSELPEYLDLIIGCVIAAALVVIVVGIVAVLYERRRRYRKSDDRKQLCMSYVSKLHADSVIFRLKAHGSYWRFCLQFSVSD